MYALDKYILVASIASLIMPAPIVYIGIAYTTYNIVKNKIEEYLD